MGLVKVQVTVDAPCEKVFEMARRVEDYPAFMPDVEDVKVLERDDKTGIAKVKWIAKVEIGSISKKVRWVEEEQWDPKNLKGTFNQVEGDYKYYGGSWNFELSDDNKTKLTLEIDFDLGLPLVGPLINKLLDRLMQTNCQGMLDAIKKRVEGQK